MSGVTGVSKSSEDTNNTYFLDLLGVISQNFLLVHLSGSFSSPGPHTTQGRRMTQRIQGAPGIRGLEPIAQAIQGVTAPGGEGKVPEGKEGQEAIASRLPGQR